MTNVTAAENATKVPDEKNASADALRSFAESLKNARLDDEFTAGGLTLRCRAMSARAQFHVARRLAPVLGGIFASLGPDPESLDDDAGLRIAAAIGDALGNLKDDACDHILDACLDVVEVRQEAGGWALLRRNRTLMFPIDLAALLVITGRVIAVNLAGFISALRANGLAGGLATASNG